MRVRGGERERKTEMVFVPQLSVRSDCGPELDLLLIFVLLLFFYTAVINTANKWETFS